MKLTYDIIGREEVAASFAERKSLVIGNVFRTVKALTYELERHVKQDKLQGQVLHHRSGRLANSVHSEFYQESQTTLYGAVGTNVEYAAIHEFGGTIPAHVVMAKTAQALAFIPKGSDEIIFRRKVMIPDVQMPERSFLRSALTDMRGKIHDDIEAAARGGARGQSA